MAKVPFLHTTLNDTTYQYINNEDITTTPVDGVYFFRCHYI